MTNKEKKKAQKQLEELAKRRRKELELRNKKLKAAQKANARAGSRTAVPQRGNPLSFLFSIKGIALTSVTGYLFVAQRELLASIGGMLFKYPLMLVVWAGRLLLNFVVKPLILRIIKMRGSRSSSLPGGSY